MEKLIVTREYFLLHTIFFTVGDLETSGTRACDNSRSLIFKQPVVLLKF